MSPPTQLTSQLPILAIPSGSHKGVHILSTFPLSTGEQYRHRHPLTIHPTASTLPASPLARAFADVEGAMKWVAERETEETLVARLTEVGFRRRSGAVVGAGVSKGGGGVGRSSSGGGGAGRSSPGGGASGRNSPGSAVSKRAKDRSYDRGGGERSYGMCHLGVRRREMMYNISPTEWETMAGKAGEELGNRIPDEEKEKEVVVVESGNGWSVTSGMDVDADEEL